MSNRYRSDPLLIRQLVELVSRDPSACSLLSRSALPAEREYFIAHLNSLAPSATAENVEDIFSSFLQWCSQNRVNTHVMTALAQRNAMRAKMDFLHKEVKQKLWLSPKGNNPRLQNFLAGIPTYQVDVLDKPYPPLGYWIYESDAIKNIWEDFLRFGRQPDPRLSRKPPMMLDVSKLEHDVEANESAIFKDGDDIVLIVMRDFCKDARVVQWIDNVIKEYVGYTKSVRVSTNISFYIIIIIISFQLEDPGKICQAGYSAGARSKPHFDWVRNLLVKMTAAEMDELNYKTSSAFAVFWNMLKTHMPKDIIDDITDFCDVIGIYRMDANRGLPSSTGTYTMELEGLPIQFNDVELAPPCGVMAANYARAIHFERQPHKYAAAWTTGRTFADDDGGHFFLSQYGIRVHAAANTAIVWQPEMPHGTSLQRLSPLNPTHKFAQSGLSVHCDLRSNFQSMETICCFRIGRCS
jgi:hypothetical protein